MIICGILQTVAIFFKFCEVWGRERIFFQNFRLVTKEKSKKKETKLLKKFERFKKFLKFLKNATDEDSRV